MDCCLRELAAITAYNADHDLFNRMLPVNQLSLRHRAFTHETARALMVLDKLQAHLQTSQSAWLSLLQHKMAELLERVKPTLGNYTSLKNTLK